MENLYNLVSNTTSSTDKQSKIQIGYTVDNYNGVLAALQRARAQVAAQGGAGGAGGEGGGTVEKRPIFKRWTNLNSITKIGNSVTDDGFVIDDVGNVEVFRQQQVRVLGYMPFVVSIPDENGASKPNLVYFEAKRGSLDKGTSVKGKHTFPNVPMTKEDCDSAGVHLGSIENPFEIGIGVDLTDGGTADAFFQKCYKNIFKRGCAKRLAEKGALLAEVAFPGSGGAHTVHIRVTAEAGKSPQNEIHTIFFPLPLLLTSEYNILGKVQVNTGEYKTVGEGDCKYPFAGSKFYHKESKLDDFSPKYLKDLIANNQVLDTKDSVMVGYNSKTYSLGEGQGGCYIRFYCDSDKKTEVEGEFGAIPDEYKTELYKGIGEAQIGEEIIGYEEVYSGGGFQTFGSVADVTEFWAEVGKSLKNPLTAEQVIAAINLAGKWESGGDWGMWEICGSGDGDGQGVSAGKFQFTQAAGGIKVYKDMFLARGGQMSAGFQHAIDTARSKYKVTRAQAQGLLAYKSEFANQAATKEGKLAQCDVWKKEKGDITMECYNMMGCTTAAEFSSIFSAVNHHPIIKKNYRQWLSYIQSQPNGLEKVRAIENAHWAAIANYYYHRNATPSMINASYIRGLSARFGKGWANRYNDSMNAYQTMG